VWQQIQFAKDRPIGYTREGLIMVRKSSDEHWRNAETLRQELLATGAVAGVAESAGPPTAVWFNNSGFNWKGKDPNMHDDFANLAVAHDYGKTMGWEFSLGRDFSREHVTDSSGLILNEAAVEFMGLDDPIDEEITWQGKKYHVIGVIKDMIMTSPYEPVKQTIFRLIPFQGLWINIRLNPEMSTAESIEKIAKVFQTLAPATPFEYKFVDEEYALKFAGKNESERSPAYLPLLPSLLVAWDYLVWPHSLLNSVKKKSVSGRYWVHLLSTCGKCYRWSLLHW
jgi:hypothetical protein